MNPLSMLWGSVAGKVAMVLVVVLGVWGGVQSYRLNSLEADVAQRVAKAEKARADAEKVQREIEEGRRNDREQAIKDIQEAKDGSKAYVSELETKLAKFKVVQLNAEFAAAAATERDRLRDSLATQRLASQTGINALTACNARATTYEERLAEGDRVVAGLRAFGPRCIRVAGEVAEARDGFAAEVVGCVKAWPK